MSKPSGLYVNCKPANCSIYESGVMFGRALQNSSRYDLDIAEVDTFDAISRSYDFYVFNYHHVTMKWLAAHRVRELPGPKIAFVLEMEQNDPFVLCPDAFDAYCIPDPTLRYPDQRVHAFGRPLELATELPPYVDQGIPVIGSFGFATIGKGFDTVVEAANAEFDRAIVRLNIPLATFADPSARLAKLFAEQCRALAKPGIEVQADHVYMEKPELIRWCAQNTINVFFYDRRLPGLSATTDQAIASGRPLLVSTCDTFRHIHQYIRPYPESSLREAIESTPAAVQAMQNDWHPNQFRAQFEGVLESVAPRISRARIAAPVEEPTEAPGPTSLNLAILTHNALDRTKSCLKHLRQNTPHDYRIYVLDNASTDGTQDYLRSLTDPRIQVRYSEENLGVPGGRNALRRWLLPEVPDDGFIIYLDNDIDVHEGWAEPYLALFARNPEAGIASRSGNLMLVHRDRRQLFQTPDRTSPVDTASGGFACWMRRQACVDVGEFDENLGLFWQEDDDYAVRAIQLGWEVFAVPEAPMWHHEHSSGAAEDRLAEGGCADNARYLAEKWRAAGYVDEDGWIIHPNSSIYMPVHVRRDLQRRLGRASAFNRAEFAEALSSVRAVIEDPSNTESRVVSRLQHLLLEVFAAEIEASSPQLAGHVAAAREALRSADFRETLSRRVAPERAPATEPKGRGRISKLCSATDWDDPAWLAEAEEIFHDRSGPAYHHRNMGVWLQTQMQRGLRELDCLRDSAEGLLYMAQRHALIWSLANHVRKLVVADNYGERGDRAMVENPTSVAPIPFAADRIEVVDTRDMPFGDGAFDFVCVPNISSLGSAEMVIRGVREVARVVRPGGTIALGYASRVDAAEQHNTPRRAVQMLTAASGCDLVEEPDFRISEETLDGIGEGDWDNSRVPYLVHCQNGCMMTTGVLFLTKPVVVRPQPASTQASPTTAPIAP